MITTGINYEHLALVLQSKSIHGNGNPKIAPGVSYTFDPLTLKKIKR